MITLRSHSGKGDLPFTLAKIEKCMPMRLPVYQLRAMKAEEFKAESRAGKDGNRSCPAWQTDMIKTTNTIARLSFAFPLFARRKATGNHPA